MTQEIAAKLAAGIRRDIESHVSNRISRATLTTSLALHIVLESVAKELDVDVAQFKRDCGVGQPLAYFV